MKFLWFWNRKLSIANYLKAPSGNLNLYSEAYYSLHRLKSFSLLIRLYSFCYFHKHFSLYYLIGFDKAKGAHKAFLVLDVIKG